MDDKTVQDWISRWSCPAGATPLCVDACRSVILVAPRASLEFGLRAARAALDRGEGPVWIIARGATLRHRWPRWLRGRDDVLLTEVTALRRKSRLETTAELTPAIRAWIDDWLLGILPAPASQRVFSTACARMFQDTIDDYPLILGCADALAGRSVVGVGPWSEWSALADLMRARGGALRAPNTTVKPVTAARRLGAVAAAGALTVATMASHVRDWVRAAAARRAVEDSHARNAEPPALWIGLLPSWHRMNRIVIESVVKPAIQRGVRFGTLMIVEVYEGARDEHSLTTIMPGSFGVGFGDVRDEIFARPLEQACVPDSVSGLVADLAVGSARCARAVSRMVNFPPCLELHGMQFVYDPMQVARLASVDVARASFAERRAAVIADVVGASGAPVVLATTGFTALGTICAELQSRGIPVAEVVHGSVGEGWDGVSEIASRIAFVPTRADQRALESTGLRVELGALPNFKLAAPRAAGVRRRNVLLASNYQHRDVVSRFGNYLEATLDEALRTFDLLRAEAGLELNFRWRPHPADVPALVAKMHATRPWVDLSHNVRSLGEDLTWADLVVTSPSSSASEALFAGIPVFLHAEPDLWRTPVAEWMAPDRVYYHAEDGARQIVRTLHSMSESPERVLEPERRAREYLFGGDSVGDTLSKVLQIAREFSKES